MTDAQHLFDVVSTELRGSMRQALSEANASSPGATAIQCARKRTRETFRKCSDTAERLDP